MHLVSIRLRAFRHVESSSAHGNFWAASKMILITPLEVCSAHCVIKISWCLSVRFLRHPSTFNPHLQVRPRHAHVSPRCLPHTAPHPLLLLHYSVPSPICPSRCLTRPHAPQHPTSAGPSRSSHPARLLSLRSTLPTPRPAHHAPRAGWMYDRVGPRPARQHSWSTVRCAA